MTAKWETYLRKIGNGQGSSELFLGSIAKYLNQLILDVPTQLNEKTLHMTIENPVTRKEVAPCPTCKKGTIISRKNFYGCSAYKAGCKQTFPSIFLKKRINVKHIEDLCVKGSTDVVKGFVAKSGKTFNAKLELTNGKITLNFL